MTKVHSLLRKKCFFIFYYIYTHSRQHWIESKAIKVYMGGHLKSSEWAKRYINLTVCTLDLMHNNYKFTVKLICNIFLGEQGVEIYEEFLLKFVNLKSFFI